MRQFSKKSWFSGLSVFLCLGMSSSLFSQEKASKQTASSSPSHVAYPNGKTLPEGVVGLQSVVNQKSSEASWNEQGQKSDLGVDVQVLTQASVLQYGITPKLTLQFMVPWVFQNNATLSVQRFRNSDIYRNIYKQKVLEIYQRKEVQKLFLTIESFQKALDDGLDLPVPMEQELPTGDKIRVGNQASIHNYIDSLILHGAAPQEGAIGLGDMRVGALYQVFSDSWRAVAFGVGAEVPTAKADIPESKRALGSGLWSFALRSSLDVSPVSGLWFSYQHQVAQSLGQKYKEFQSLLDNTKTISKENESLLYERFGIKQEANLSMKYGFGALTPYLKAFAAGGSLNWYKSYQDIEHHVSNDFKSVQTNRQPVSQGYTQGAFFRADALPYGLPLALEWTGSRTLYAENQKLSFVDQSLSLSAYYKF
ncbi:MAG: hypothetical protein AB8C84_11165 [Oligoflexales bacterium]